MAFAAGRQVAWASRGVGSLRQVEGGKGAPGWCDWVRLHLMHLGGSAAGEGWQSLPV